MSELPDDLPKYQLRTQSFTAGLLNLLAIFSALFCLTPLVEYREIRLERWPVSAAFFAAALLLQFMSMVLEKQHQTLHETERNGVTLERIALLLHRQKETA